jgi:hypothetical protein
MSLPPSANSRDRWLDLADEARDKARAALANGDRRMAELWDEHERTLLRNAYEDVPHPDAGAPATGGGPAGTVGDLTGPISSQNPFDAVANDPDVASPRSVADGEGVQVADESAAPPWMIARMAPFVAGAALARQTMQDLDDRRKKLRDGASESRPSGSLSAPAEPFPPIQTPGFPLEPPFDPEEWNKEILPAQPIVAEGEVLPADEPNEGLILINPDQSDEFPQIPFVERKGNSKTRAELERLRDAILKQHPDWEHLAGGRTKEGKELPEYWIPGPGKAFPDGDGRPGGRWIDLTFRKPSGKLIHVQTVDIDRNGKPTKEELDAAEAIRRARYDRDRKEESPIAEVYLVPKDWQRYPRLKILKPR